MEVRICNKCNSNKPIECFIKSRDKPTFICKSCESVRSKEYRLKNKEKLNLKQKEYRENNKEKISEQNKEWYLKNSETTIEKNKARYRDNKTEILKRKAIFIVKSVSGGIIFIQEINIFT